MKTLFSFILLSLLAVPVFAQSTSIVAFSGMSVPDSNTSRTDTSYVYTVGGYPNIDIVTTADNADSIAMTTYVDVQLNGDWYNSVASLALQKGHPSLHTPANTHGQNGDLPVRDQGRLLDLLQAGTVVRIRNVITGADFAPKTNMNYSQVIQLRKSTAY